jgi:hypothetical protein
VLQVTLNRDRVVHMGIYPRYATDTGGSVIDGEFLFPRDIDRKALKGSARVRTSIAMAPSPTRTRRKGEGLGH